MGLLYSTPSMAASTAKISKSKANLCVGETLQLKVSGGSGKVTWSSSNKKVAAVSKNGLVTAKSKGSCTITAKKAGKKYTCKVKVNALPEGYATVNGKKVKVGSNVKLIYYIQSESTIASMHIECSYSAKGLKLVGNVDDCFKYWLTEKGSDGENAGKYKIFYQVVGVSKKDPYNIAAISCKKKKVLANMKLKVLKSGNYTVKFQVRDCYTIEAGITKDVEKYTITETVK